MSALQICGETTTGKYFRAEALLHFKTFNFIFILLWTDRGIIRRQQPLTLVPDDTVCDTDNTPCYIYLAMISRYFAVWFFIYKQLYLSLIIFLIYPYVDKIVFICNGFTSCKTLSFYYMS